MSTPRPLTDEDLAAMHTRAFDLNATPPGVHSPIHRQLYARTGQVYRDAKALIDEVRRLRIANRTAA